MSQVDSPTLSERARELVAWLRETESHVSDMADAARRDGSQMLVEINEGLATLFKSRAECVEALLADNARLEADLKERGWQLIKDAPRDGTVVDLSVLVTFPGGHTDRLRWTDCYWDDDQKWLNGGDAEPEKGWSQADGERVCKATHWMPIPERPLPPPSPQGETE